MTAAERRKEVIESWKERLKVVPWSRFPPLAIAGFFLAYESTVRAIDKHDELMFVVELFVFVIIMFSEHVKGIVDKVFCTLAQGRKRPIVSAIIIIFSGVFFYYTKRNEVYDIWNTCSAEGIPYYLCISYIIIQVAIGFCGGFAFTSYIKYICRLRKEYEIHNNLDWRKLGRWYYLLVYSILAYVIARALIYPQNDNVWYIGHVSGGVIIFFLVESLVVIGFSSYAKLDMSKEVTDIRMVFPFGASLAIFSLFTCMSITDIIKTKNVEWSTIIGSLTTAAGYAIVCCHLFFHHNIEGKAKVRLTFFGAFHILWFVFHIIVSQYGEFWIPEQFGVFVEVANPNRYQVLSALTVCLVISAVLLSYADFFIHFIKCLIPSEAPTAAASD
jgi:hypothetical protein